MVRFKNRYFVAEIEVKGKPSHAPFPISKHAIQSSILSKIHQIHGDFGLAAVTAGIRIKYCNPFTKIVLIRSRHGPHRFVGTVLPLIKSIEKVNVQFNTLYVGGTMMKCFKYIRADFYLTKNVTITHCPQVPSKVPPKVEKWEIIHRSQPVEGEASPGEGETGTQGAHTTVLEGSQEMECRGFYEKQLPAKH